MIDEEILDQLIPVPDEDKAMRDLQEELTEAGFIINNFNKGGVLYTILRISVRIGREIKLLARQILNSCFIWHAEGDWLKVKAADHGKRLKEAVRAQGYITLVRSDSSHALQIRKGHMFKTRPDVNGREYKFYVVEDTVIAAGEETGKVLAEAEKSGSDYNLSPETVTVSMIHLEGVDHVTNAEGWLYREGADEESIESLRSRTLSSWDEIAERTIDEKLRNVARSVPGVLNAEIDSQHPRGQGTVDIIITGSAGEATEKLLAEVSEAVGWLKGNYDDFLCRSATIVRQDISLELYLAKGVSTDSVAEKCEYLINRLLRLQTREELNCLYLDDIRVLLAENIKEYRRAVFTEPEADLELPKDKVIMAGDITVSVRHVGGDAGV